MSWGRGEREASPGRGDAPELLATDVLAREKPPRDARVALAEGVHEGAERSKGEAPRKTERNNGLAIARDCCSAKGKPTRRKYHQI